MKPLEVSSSGSSFSRLLVLGVDCAAGIPGFLAEILDKSGLVVGRIP